MLSGERNGGKRWKTTIGLISKKVTLHVQYTFCTFLCRCFVRLQRETSRNFVTCLEEMSYVFLFTCFSLPLIFTLHWWPLAVLILSPPLHRCSSDKKMSPLFFISRSRYLSLFLVELRWPAAYFLFFSVFLLLCIPNLWSWQFIKA